MTINPRTALALALGLAANAQAWAPVVSRPAPKHSSGNHRAKKPVKKARKAQRVARRQSRRKP